MMRFLCQTAVFFLCFQSVSLWAAPPERLDQLGPLKMTTLEFPNLKDDKRGGRRVPIKVHLPQQQGKWPVVVFSHGGGGNWNANFAQASHLASHGYAVLCLEHVGSNTERMKEGLRFMDNVKAMTRSSSEVLGRPKDVSFTLDMAEEWNRTHPELKGRLDLEHVGVMGHSFGAYTTLVVCGARPALDWLTPSVSPGKGLGPDLRDSRVAAGVALSPQGPGEPFFLEASYSTVKTPLLGITGSHDKQQGAPPEHRRRFFELLPPGGKVFIWLANADHLGFSDSNGSGQRSLPSKSRADVQPLVRAATLLFFNATLRGDREAEKALSSESLSPLLRGVVNEMEIQKK
jgi:predicted dienelactone hydrolase